MSSAADLGWPSILRLGLVQSALGAVFVLMTSTLNRVMVVELALPAVLPGALIGLQYAVQIARPRFGYGSDRAARRSAWIVGGMAVLSLGAIGAAAATWLMAVSPIAGLVAAIAAFVAIGAGMGAAGTSLLALLASRVAPARRAAAAAVVWLMMIVGIIVAAGSAGALLSPFSLARLFVVCTSVAVIAWLLSVAGVWGIESGRDGPRRSSPAAPASPGAGFRAALAGCWTDRRARLCTFFVFFAMLAYSVQDLILEPFAGLVFGLSPGQTTELTGLVQTGALLGMLSVGALASGIGVPRIGTLRGWAIAGCSASALALAALAAAARHGPPWPIHATAFVLGFANGAFVIAAIGLMMSLAGGGGREEEREDGGQNVEGTRMGVWGAAQAVASGLGGLLATGSVNALAALPLQPATPYAIVFGVQALLFALAALVVLGVDPDRDENRDQNADPRGTPSASTSSSGASP